VAKNHHHKKQKTIKLFRTDTSCVAAAAIVRQQYTIIELFSSHADY
jgi:hypothetical protein